MESDDDNAIIDELFEVYKVLFADLISTRDQLATHDQQVWRRAYCRSLFALIEGCANLLKKYILHFWPGLVAGGETELRLRDQKSASLRVGSTQTVTSFLPFGVNTRFALDTCAWVTGADFALDTRTADWQRLDLTTKIRNRITHPRTLSDLAITDEELRLLESVATWFVFEFFGLLKQGAESILEETQAMRRNIEAFRQKANLPS